jgi:hypothetical protein
VRVFIAVIIFLCVSLTCEAALYIDDTSTTQKRHFILDFSGDYYKEVEKELQPGSAAYTKTVSKEIAISSDLYYGLADNWELGVTLPYRFLDDSACGEVNGVSDIMLDTKYRFWEETKSFPSFALYLDVKTKSGNEDKSLGTGSLSYSINNIFTKTAGDNFFDLNLGYTFVDASDDVFSFALDWERILSDSISVCNEIYGETTFKGDFDKNIFLYAISVDSQLNELVCLESGVGIGISKESPDYQVSTTLTFNF